MDLAQQAVPILMRRTKNVIHKFIESDSQSGNLPISRGELTEIVFVLSHLKSSKIHPSLKLVDNDNLPKNYSNSDKKHLLYLFPLLCECITTKENSIKPLLKEIFHITSSEVGLE